MNPYSIDEGLRHLQIDCPVTAQLPAIRFIQVDGSAIAKKMIQAYNEEKKEAIVWPGLRNAIEKITSQAEFLTHPVEYLYNWHAKHPDAEFNWKGAEPIEYPAINVIARDVMRSEGYVDQFCDNLAERASLIFEAVYPAPDNKVTQKIQKIFMERLKSQEFRLHLTHLRDLLIRDCLPSCAHTQIKPEELHDNLNVIINDTELRKRLPSPKGIIIKDISEELATHEAQRVLHMYIRSHFDFMHNNNFREANKHKKITVSAETLEYLQKLIHDIKIQNPE